MSSQKISETGWFYHAPAKRQENPEPISAPPASQIPGLSALPDDPSLQNDGKIWIRDTDSDYIKLSKMGGRPDLLRQRTPKGGSKEPVGYPKVDWFYLDDNAMEERVKNDHNLQSDGQYEFMLPEYMVHQGYQPMGDSRSVQNHKAPYAHEDSTVYQREGDQVRDKTVKLPELRQGGYGIRQEKQQGKSVKHMKMPNTQQAKPPSSELDEGKFRYKPMPAAPEADQPVMSKLLSYGYGKDWRTDREHWYEKQEQMREKFDVATENKMCTQSEYQEQMSKNSKKSSAQSSAARSGKPSSSNRSSARDEARKNKANNQGTKELFKMNKFKNVPSKTDSRRTSDLPQQSAAVKA